LAERLFGLGAAKAEAIIVLGTILIITLILLLIGALPAWPYSTFLAAASAYLGDRQLSLFY
jgi:Protein of unknown function (DUF3309)